MKCVSDSLCTLFLVAGMREAHFCFTYSQIENPEQICYHNKVMMMIDFRNLDGEIGKCIK